MMRQLITNPCQDACGEITTDRSVEGAPVYRCPGCDSEWIELDELVSATQPGGVPRRSVQCCGTVSRSP